MPIATDSPRHIQPATGGPAAEVVDWFAAAARYLHRPDPTCPEHGVAHTGKLARAIVLDLALLAATGGAAYLDRAVGRARYVAARLAPDPEHGGLIYLPGRLDPRNCSTSLIDSGECTDALARLLRHDRAASLPAEDRALLWHTVERNAETYLRQTIAQKGITNQRLWGAMGLASAYQLAPHAVWRAAIREALARSLTEQRADGLWGYEPGNRGGTSRPAAPSADLTVYYHGRCLAFLFHILDCVPDVDEDGRAEAALYRGLAFLAAVIAPDGLKPLALEGKRWFWDGSYEAGSNAYDVYALLRGAERFGRVDWRRLAHRCWRQLARHQQSDGGLKACHDPHTCDFVCRDFHTADLAWTAQVMLEGARAKS